MILHHRVRLGGLLVAIAMGRPLDAQVRSTLELGASYVRFPQDSTSVTGPSLRWTASQTRGRLGLTGSVSGVAGGSRASGYGEAEGRWLAPLGAGLSGELSGELGGLLSPGAASTSVWASSAVASARLLRVLGPAGVWVRASGNLATREAGPLWGRGVDAGAWWRRPGLQLAAGVTREWSVAQLFLGPGRRGLVGVIPVRYTEGSVGALVEGDATSLAVSAQVRHDPGAEPLVEPGYVATATWWRTATQAFVVSVARQLPDFVHGADASRSVTVGIRLNDPSPLVARVRVTRPVIQVSDSAPNGDAAARTRTLRLRAPGATRVEVMGDFTDWEPAELSPDGDVFSAHFPLSPGTHRLVVRIDGGPWMPAANTPAVDDDFGGRVGLLVVP